MPSKPGAPRPRADSRSATRAGRMGVDRPAELGPRVSGPWHGSAGGASAAPPRESRSPHRWLAPRCARHAAVLRSRSCRGRPDGESRPGVISAGGASVAPPRESRSPHRWLAPRCARHAAVPRSRSCRGRPDGESRPGVIPDPAVRRGRPEDPRPPSPVGHHRNTRPGPHLGPDRGILPPRGRSVSRSRDPGGRGLRLGPLRPRPRHSPVPLLRHSARISSDRGGPSAPSRKRGPP